MHFYGKRAKVVSLFSSVRFRGWRRRITPKLDRNRITCVAHPSETSIGPLHRRRSQSRQSADLVRFAVLTLATCALRAGPAYSESWFDELPASARRSILWKCDFETGDFSAWIRPGSKHPGAGIFNTGGRDAEARVVLGQAHSGKWSAQTRISGALGANSGPRAVRLMAWTDRPWDEKGRHFPNDAWYSVWMLIPHAYRTEPDNVAEAPGRSNPGWWNVFQFKSEGSTGESEPTWIVNVYGANGKLSLYLYSPLNTPASYEPAPLRSFAPGEWVHVEVHYASARRHGRVELFQNGELLVAARNVVTSLGGSDGTDVHPIWGIGNYTDHIAGDPHGAGRSTIFFDDACVSMSQLGDRGD